MIENALTIDFTDIISMDDFYKKLNTSDFIPEYFGNNLDALYDVLTGHVPLPFALSFINMRPQQLVQFDALLNVLKDVREEMKNEFSFSYFIKLPF